MSVRPPPVTSEPRAPPHLFVLAFLLLLWNAWGMLLAIVTQTGQMTFRPEDASYFAAQPLWLVLIADIAPFAGVAGAVALLLQARAAVWLFGIQLGVLVLTNGYELVSGTSIMFFNPDTVAPFIGLLVILVAQIAYARWLQKRGVLT